MKIQIEILKDNKAAGLTKGQTKSVDKPIADAMVNSKAAKLVKKVKK